MRLDGLKTVRLEAAVILRAGLEPPPPTASNKTEEWRSRTSRHQITTCHVDCDADTSQHPHPRDGLHRRPGSRLIHLQPATFRGTVFPPNVCAFQNLRPEAQNNMPRHQSRDVFSVLISVSHAAFGQSTGTTGTVSSTNPRPCTIPSQPLACLRRAHRASKLSPPACLPSSLTAASQTGLRNDAQTNRSQDATNRLSRLRRPGADLPRPTDLCVTIPCGFPLYVLCCTVCQVLQYTQTKGPSASELSPSRRRKQHKQASRSPTGSVHFLRSWLSYDTQEK
ncbi:hypothetical protein VTK26DRAFT_195 [Humicola hyalothermophila]